MHPLLQIPLFAGLSAEVLSDWLAQTQHHITTFSKGDRLVEQGESCLSALFLTRGSVITEMSQEGRGLMVERMDAPQLLASAFLYGTHNYYPVSVVAESEGELWHIDKDALFAFMLQQPSVMRQLVLDVSDRTQFLSQKLRLFALQGLRARVLNLLRQKGKLPSVQETALMLGVQRPSLSRVLSELVEEGLVRRHTRSFTLAKG